MSIHFARRLRRYSTESFSCLREKEGNEEEHKKKVGRKKIKIEAFGGLPELDASGSDSGEENVSLKSSIDFTSLYIIIKLFSRQHFCI